jgi:hypothetical protein
MLGPSIKVIVNGRFPVRCQPKGVALGVILLSAKCRCKNIRAAAIEPSGAGEASYYIGGESDPDNSVICSPCGSAIGPVYFDSWFNTACTNNIGPNLEPVLKYHHTSFG